MLQRFGAAAVGLLVVIPALIFGGELAAFAIIALAAAVGFFEWSRMAVPELGQGAFVVQLVVGLSVLSSIVFLPAVLGTASVALGAIMLLVYALFAVKETERAAGVATKLVGGLVYVAVLISFIVSIRRFDDGVAWVFLLLAATWMGDTGAYFAGRFLGKNKLFERISPKKTWEGAIGGLFTAVAAGAVVKVVGLDSVPWVHVLVVAGLIDVVGIVGDLVESMFKRSFGVKDSGSIMPGHGGILDRIDSLLFSAPVAWIYWTVVSGAAFAG